MLSKPGFALFDSQPFLEIVEENDSLGKLPGNTAFKILLSDLILLPT